MEESGPSVGQAPASASIQRVSQGSDPFRAKRPRSPAPHRRRSWALLRRSCGSDFRVTQAPLAFLGKMALQDYAAFLGTEGSLVQW